MAMLANKFRKKASKRTEQRWEEKVHPAIPNGTRLQARAMEAAYDLKEQIGVGGLGPTLDAVFLALSDDPVLRKAVVKKAKKLVACDICRSKSVP
jgi:hypothetical protein